MSFLVLHMDKFKKEAVRGIQSHNNRERKSHSNPDIEYSKSQGNYDLHGQKTEYAQAIQHRIDDLLLVKAVRKDAVHMCGIIVSSDSAFFEELTPEDTRRFFEESKAFLTEFVGPENVISAMVHMDEKTPHMHFLHVPVTPDGKLSAKTLYTRESLKKLQTEFPRHLQSCGFDVQRGVEQEPGSAKKHLDTREFKQQQEAVRSLEKEAKSVSNSLEQCKQEEAAAQERVQAIQQQAWEAEKELSVQAAIPQVSMFNFKAALEAAQTIIERQKKALAEKSILVASNQKLQAEVKSLHETVNGLHKQLLASQVKQKEEQEQSSASILNLAKDNQNLLARQNNYERFFRLNPEANKMHLDFIQEERREAARKAQEQKRLEQERALQQEKERREAELAQQRAAEQQRQQEQEQQKAREVAVRPRGMGMSR